MNDPWAIVVLLAAPAVIFILYKIFQKKPEVESLDANTPTPETETAIAIEKSLESIKSLSSLNCIEDNATEEELIAVITAAISAMTQKHPSGFRVVSFKKRGSWKFSN